MIVDTRAARSSPSFWFGVLFAPLAHSLSLWFAFERDLPSALFFFVLGVVWPVGNAFLVCFFSEGE